MQVEARNAEVDERHALARLALDESGERDLMLRRLKSGCFTWRYRPWFIAIEALHAGPEQIDPTALLALTGANGVHSPFKEWLLICSEIPDDHAEYEDLSKIVERVIANSLRRWLYQSLQAMLKHAQGGDVKSFDDASTTASRLIRKLHVAREDRNALPGVRRRPMSFDQRQRVRTQKLGGHT
jgi:hypothetical protein